MQDSNFFPVGSCVWSRSNVGLDPHTWYLHDDGYSSKWALSGWDIARKLVWMGHFRVVLLACVGLVALWFIQRLLMIPIGGTTEIVAAQVPAKGLRRHMIVLCSSWFFVRPAKSMRMLSTSLQNDFNIVIGKNLTARNLHHKHSSNFLLCCDLQRLSQSTC